MGQRKVTIITYDCPGCGVSIQVDPEQTSATCEYCGMHFAIESDNVSSPNVEYTGNGRGESRSLSNNPKVVIALVLGIVLIVGFGLMSVVVGGIFSAASMIHTSRVETQVTEADPFKDVKVKLEGMEPWASVSEVTSGSEIYGVKYNLDKQTGLSNGDVITITAEDMAGYTWTRSSFEYTVSGLDCVVMDVSQLSEADQEILYSEAKKEIEKNWEINLANSDADLESLHLNIQPYKLYINVNKDEDAAYFSDKNAVYPAFETTFEDNGKIHTVYQYAEIDNVYVTSNGAMHGDFNTINATGGYIYSCDLGFEESFAVWGFETILRMESDMENEQYDLIK